MFLACPACSSRFRVNPQAIGEGRDVRCSKCGNEWFALSSDVLDEKGVAIAPAPPKSPPPPPEPELEEAPPVRAQPVPKEYEPEIGMPLGDEVSLADIQAAMEEERSQAAEHVIDEDDDEEEEEAFVESRPEEPLDDIDFDALDQAIAVKTASLPSASSGDSKSLVMPLAIVCLVLLVLNIATALMFFREPISRTIPAMIGLYRALGYQPTSGLSFSDLRLMRYGSPKLPRFDVAGVVLNGADYTLTEPDIRLSLVSKKGEVIREWQLSGGDKEVPKEQPLHFSTQNEFLRASRAAEAEALVLHLGSPLELSLSHQ